MLAPRSCSCTMVGGRGGVHTDSNSSLQVTINHWNWCVTKYIWKRAMTGWALCQCKLHFFNMLGVWGQLGCKGTPPQSFSEPPGSIKSKPHIKNREDRVTSLYNRELPCKFWCQLDVYLQSYGCLRAKYKINSFIACRRTGTR